VLHIFDMDGTILLGTAAAELIAEELDIVEFVEELEAGFASGALTPPMYAERIFEHWKRLDAAAIRRTFDAAPWIDDMTRVTADIRARGEHSIVITLSPHFFAEHLVDFGFDRVYGSPFPPLPFTEPLDTSILHWADDKPRIARQHVADVGLTLDDVIAYGDSGSDVPLFQLIRRTVAMNASAELTALAATSYTGRSLWSAYELARQL
jgi:phosphoserine phosphatase